MKIKLDLKKSLELPTTFSQLSQLLISTSQIIKKVFAAFIDLRKAFDMIWREGLLYKLFNHKFPAGILKIIHSMYQDPCCSLKFKQGLSRNFISKCGVKQGDVLSPILFNLYIDDLITNLNKEQTEPVEIGDTSVSCLLYADDIILLSSTQGGLQKSLDVLEKFCTSWKLEVNEQKSKVIVFNSNGKSYLNRFKFKNNIIETVKSYCYLGVTLKYTGNLNSSSKILMEKGRKAWFKIKKYIGLNNSCIFLEKLFDTLINPIILYGCEVWGAYCKFKDTDPFEHLHIKFLKEILGVNSKTSNVACLAELNRLPLKVKILIQVIKFWEHITNSTNTLVNKIYCNIPSNNRWVSTVQKWINELGFNYLITNTHNIKQNIPFLMQRIADQAIQNLHSSIRENRKLAFYNNIYNLNKRPPYVDICKFKADRSTISKFRISAHSLAVERGRYSYIPKDKRLCVKCDTALIEDELHFFVFCPAYKKTKTRVNSKTMQ